MKASHILISADGQVYLSGLRSIFSLIRNGQRTRVVHDFPQYSVKVLPWLSPEVLQQVCLLYIYIYTSNLKFWSVRFFYKNRNLKNKIMFLERIRMIPEGSCDTEDWSNDAENTALHHRNKLHLKIYSNCNVS